MMFKRFHIAFVATAVAFLLPIAQSAVGAEGDFMIDGGGWGHGVGMSQYGAYGMAALDGVKVDEIIGHYYSDAQLTDAAGLAGVPAWILEPEALAVNVASKRTHLDFQVISSTTGVEVCQTGDGHPDQCTEDSSVSDNPDDTVMKDETLRVRRNGDGTCTRSILLSGATKPGSAVTGDCHIDITWDDSGPDSGIYSVDTRIQIPDSYDNPDLIYARGPFELRPHDSAPTFDVTVRLGLEEYLLGLGEMPLGWPIEALKAQAVAARSYAVRLVTARGGPDGTGRLADCGCHIRRTTADQNYDAWWVEGYDVTGNWHTAVADTAGKVVTHKDVDGGNSVLATYYSSSTGGATENVEDIFGGSPQPYLKSVDDHWAVDPSINNPYAKWTKLISKAAAAQWLGWDEVRSVKQVAGPPGTVVHFEGMDAGAPVTADKTGAELRAAFGLLSPYVSDVTREGPPPPPFTDISGSIHYDNIAYIWRAGVTKGCNPPDNTLYCPTDPVTRQQMASFLVRALGLPAAQSDHFTDDAGSVHEGDINSLAEAGITKGCNPPDNTRYCPERRVTRGEMAAFLVRAFGYTDQGSGNLFTDDDSSIFEADIDRLAVAGVTKGCNPPDNTRFCPDDPVTREQMASFLARALRAAGG